jgi:hypothetical protein
MAEKELFEWLPGCLASQLDTLDVQLGHPEGATEWRS